MATDFRFTCHDCGDRLITIARHNRMTCGYASLGRSEDAPKICYKCCAVRDRKRMVEDGHSRSIPLYLSEHKTKDAGGTIMQHHVSNWPGTLAFPAWGYSTPRGHNWGLTRTDIWFNGPDGHVWHGYHLGNFTQIVHCKRTRELVQRAG